MPPRALVAPPRRTRGSGSRPRRRACSRGRSAARTAGRRCGPRGRGAGSRSAPRSREVPRGCVIVQIEVARGRRSGARWSTDSMTTASPGRSIAPVAVVPIASTTSRLAWSATSPKIVCLRLSHGVAAEGDEELRAVGAGAGVGHREQVGLVEDELGVDLVLERVARATGAGAERAAALDHEAVDHPVEAEAVVVLLAGAAGVVAVVLGALGEADEVRRRSRERGSGRG